MLLTFKSVFWPFRIRDDKLYIKIDFFIFESPFELLPVQKPGRDMRGQRHMHFQLIAAEYGEPRCEPTMRIRTDCELDNAMTVIGSRQPCGQIK